MSGRPGSAKDACYARLRQRPGKCQPHGGNSLFVRFPVQSTDRLELRFVKVDSCVPGHNIEARALRNIFDAAAVFAGQKARSQRAVAEKSKLTLAAQRKQIRDC